MKTLLLSSLFLFSGICALAQTKEISGVITAKEDGAPVPGVNVVVRGSGTGTVTDKDGKFVLQAPASATTLVISFVGFVTQEVTIPESNTINIQLVSSSLQLEEVVVSVGRGSQRTLTDTPLPVDVLSSKELASTGPGRRARVRHRYRI